MTIGQQIQELRKARGMSQEALGEALGVSRQAVSKWESDGAIPELDTLIAMSRLFNISLGRLLMVEESADTQDMSEETGAPALERYIKELERRGADYSRKAGYIAAGIAAALAVSLALNVFLGMRTSSLSDEINELNGRISSVEGNMNYQIQSMTSRLSEMLDQQNSICSGFTAHVIEVDIPNEKVTLSLSATLKSYSDETSAVYVITFIDKFGSQQRLESQPLHGSDILAEMEVPLNQGGEVYLDLTQPDGQHVTQLLGPLYYEMLEASYKPFVDAKYHYTAHGSNIDEVMTFTPSASLSVTLPMLPDGMEPLEIKSVKAAMYLNGKEVWSGDMEPERDHNSSSTEAAAAAVAGEALWFTMPDTFSDGGPMKFEAKESDEYVVSFTVTDNYGTITHPQVVNSGIRFIKDNGRLKIEPFEGDISEFKQ